MTAESIAIALKGRKSGAGYVACCPSHEDHNPSLSLKDADGRVLVHCHAGCDQARVVEALKARGLWNMESPVRTWATQRKRLGPMVCAYNYTDEHGELLYQVTRHFPPKDFRQRYPDGRGGWIWRKHPRQVIYRLPEVLESAVIFAVEGCKDAETLRDHGFVATTNAGGASAPWLDSYTETLRGREVILIPDNDQPGRARVLRIARALLGRVARLVVLELEGAGVKDVSDWFAAGHSELELIAQLDGEEVSR
jgi:rhodanese-related sulfurtransferase